MFTCSPLTLDPLFRIFLEASPFGEKKRKCIAFVLEKVKKTSPKSSNPPQILFTKTQMVVFK